MKKGRKEGRRKEGRKEGKIYIRDREERMKEIQKEWFKIGIKTNKKEKVSYGQNRQEGNSKKKKKKRV